MTAYKVRHLDTEAISSQPSWGDKTCFVVKDCCLSLMTPTRRGTDFVISWLMSQQNDAYVMWKDPSDAVCSHFVAAGDSEYKNILFQATGERWTSLRCNTGLGEKKKQGNDLLLCLCGCFVSGGTHILPLHTCGKMNEYPINDL